MQEQAIKTDDMEIDLLELLREMLRKFWLIVLCATLGATMLGCYTKIFTVPQYSASSTIYVLSQKISGVSLSLSAQLTTDFSILSKSRPVLERVINQLELDMSCEELAKKISVENPEDSQILQFVVTDADPMMAKDIANAMADSVASRIAEVMMIDKPTLAEEAVIPTSPVGSGVKRSIMLGGLGGVVLAAGVIVLFYLMDDTIRTEDDIKKYLDLNILASFPMTGEKKKRNLNK